MRLELKPGAILRRERYTPEEQRALIADVLARVGEAPFYRAGLPGSGQLMSVEMTNFGPLGWYTDKEKGYRYEPRHPLTNRPWPAIPPALVRLWEETAGFEAPPEACLVNLYRGRARMGLHRDRDEEADAPVLSVSLGDSALFRLGGLSRKDGTLDVVLASGDVLVLGGPARQLFHGIGRIYGGSSALVPGGGRINLTLRRVTPPAKKETAGQGSDRPSDAPLRAGAGRG